MTDRAEFDQTMAKPLTPAQNLLIRLSIAESNESPAGSHIMRLSPDEFADLECILQAHDLLVEACGVALDHYTIPAPEFYQKHGAVGRAGLLSKFRVALDMAKDEPATEAEAGAPTTEEE